MKYHPQETNFTCGASAIRNALKALGHKPISESRIRKLAKTTKEGTNEKGIMKAFRQLGYECSELVTANKLYFKKVLLKALKNKNVCIVIIDSINHWIPVIEYKYRKITFIDSDLYPIKQTINLKYFLTMCRNYDKYEKREYYYLIKINKKIWD